MPQIQPCFGPLPQLAASGFCFGAVPTLCAQVTLGLVPCPLPHGSCLTCASVPSTPVLPRVLCLSRFRVSVSQASEPEPLLLFQSYESSLLELGVNSGVWWRPRGWSVCLEGVSWEPGPNARTRRAV